MPVLQLLTDEPDEECLSSMIRLFMRDKRKDITRNDDVIIVGAPAYHTGGVVWSGRLSVESFQRHMLLG